MIIDLNVTNGNLLIHDNTHCIPNIVLAKLKYDGRNVFSRIVRVQTEEVNVWHLEEMR